MGILKRAFTILLMVVLLGSGQIWAQTQLEVRDAFKKSYKQEAAGDYKKAASTLQKVYQAESYELNLRLGWLHYQAGMFKESESYYRKAIDLFPYGIEARFGVVFPLTSLGNWEQVVVIYKEILKIDPQNSIANYRFGLVCYGRDSYEEAERLFGKVVNLYPFDYDGIHMLAWTKFKLGKFSEAQVLFQKGLLFKPDDSSCLEGLRLIK